jgi:hypothetical protein
MISIRSIEKDCRRIPPQTTNQSKKIKNHNVKRKHIDVDASE